MNKLKKIFLYGYSVIAYLIVFFLIWHLSYVLLFPNIYSFILKNKSAVTHGNEDTVLVVIDDKSMDEYRWPWKREFYGKIVNYFSEYSDIKSFGLDGVIKSEDTEDMKSDEYFYNALEKLNDKLAAVFVPTFGNYPETVNGEIYEQYFSEKFGINVEDKRKKKDNFKFTSMLVYPYKFFNAVNYAGSSKNGLFSAGGRTFDNSGFLPLSNIETNTFSVVDVNGEIYPSLALCMYLRNNNTDKITLYDNEIVVDKTGLVIPFSEKNMSTNIHFYKLYEGSLYSHKHYSASDILKSYDNLKKGIPPIVSPDEFKNKTVFFGMNARGELVGLEDADITPISNTHPGVDIQATIFDNFINSQFIYRPDVRLEFTLTLFLSIAVFAVILMLGFAMSLSVFLGITLGYFMVCWCVLYPRGIAPDAITPIVVCIATLIFGYAFKFILENKNKEKVKNAMGKYISKDVMQNVVKNIDNVKLGGRKANVTVLFADIRGFTSMSEKMTAEEVSVILNEYFSEIEPIITRYNGVINKFIGDAVMAIFGDPVEDEMHPMNAVLCANEMLKRVQKLRYKWSMENKPEIEIGIGINTGEVFVGNIGSETRLEYTVIGDTVNIASRIESYNKVYRTKFLIGSTTYESVKNRVDVIKIGGVTIRGKQKKMDIYEILRVNKPEE